MVFPKMLKFEGQFDMTLKFKITSFELKHSSVLKIKFNSKWGSYHIHIELHTYLNFHDKFDLEDQGQAHQFSKSYETFRC